MITQQGEVFRDVGSLKPSFLEKGANLMEVTHWIDQARNYIEAGFKDPPPNEGTYKYITPYIHILFKCSPSNLYLVQGRHTSFLGDHQTRIIKMSVGRQLPVLAVGAP